MQSAGLVSCRQRKQNKQGRENNKRVRVKKKEKKNTTNWSVSQVRRQEGIAGMHRRQVGGREDSS